MKRAHMGQHDARKITRKTGYTYEFPIRRRADFASLPPEADFASLSSGNSNMSPFSSKSGAGHLHEYPTARVLQWR